MDRLHSVSSENVANNWKLIEQENNIAKLQSKLQEYADKQGSWRMSISKNVRKIQQMKEIICGLKQKIQLFEDGSINDVVSAVCEVSSNAGSEFTLVTEQTKNETSFLKEKVSNWEKFKRFFVGSMNWKRRNKYWPSTGDNLSDDLISITSATPKSSHNQLSEQQNVISRYESALIENESEREKQMALLDEQEITLNHLKYVMSGLRGKLNLYEGKNSTNLYDDKIKEDILAENNMLLKDKLKRLEEQNIAFQNEFREVKRSSGNIVKLYINNSKGIAVGDNANINVGDVNGNDDDGIIGEVKSNLASISSKMTDLFTESHGVRKHLADQKVSCISENRS